MTKEDKTWIDNASYHSLLQRWRFTLAGKDDMFQGETGDYYAKVMFEKKDAIPVGEAVRISKTVGWWSR